MASTVESGTGPVGGASKSDWIVRPWCVWLAVALLLLGALLNVTYLFRHCPIDLSEDEAHYWLWAQNLDYGYYSKPPGIAWVLWMAQAVGGMLGLNGDGSGAALMPVLRLPAVLFGTLSGLLSLALARRMFRDDRVGLVVILLSAAVPMFAVGTLLITIDSPMYLCWAATVYCLWRAVEGETRNSKPETRNWLYAAGLCAAIGMLFKPVLIAIPLCAALGAWRNPVLKKTFHTRHAIGALGVLLLSQIPVLLWNAHHHWVTFRHILTQGGLGQQGSQGSVPKSPFQSLLLDPLSRLGSFLGGQAGGMGGLIFLLLVLAVILALRTLRRTPAVPGQHDAPADDHTRFTFLLCFFLPLWGFYFVMNFWKGTEVNWPAASYFTGMVLLAAIVVRQWHSPDAKTRRDWRGWTIATIIWGLLLTGVATNMHRLYPLLADRLQPLTDTTTYDKSWWNPRKWDPSAIKLRGFEARAQALDVLRQQMTAADNAAPLLIAGRYDLASSLSFYLPGHPFVYCLMSSVGGRQSQFDIWPGLDQMDTASSKPRYLFAGRSALIVGLDMDDPIVKATLEPMFDKIGPKEVLPVTYAGIVLKRLTVYRASGFRQPPPKKDGIY